MVTIQAVQAPAEPLITVLPSASTARKKVSFGGIAKKTETKTKTVYPVLPDPDGLIALIAASIIDVTEEIDSLSGALDADKAELKQIATKFYYQNANGKAEVPSSVSIASPKGEVLVTVTSKYKGVTEEGVTAVLGEATSRFFKNSFALEVDGDKIPADHAQSLIDELMELFARFNAADALSVKETFTPMPDFHARRHVELDEATNLALENACPATTMVKTKGRK